MKSTLQHSFAMVPQADIPRSKFDRSCGLKTTLNSGYLVPIFVDEALPGDTLNCRMTAFGRMATPIRPVMDNLFFDTFFIAVPIRLVWDNFKKFNGEQINPGDSTDFLVPTITSPVGGYVPPVNWETPTNIELASALSDYLGIPTRIANLKHSALWHLAYNLLWNELFRDENLQQSAPVPKTDGPHTYTDFILRKRGKRHDYFTSCLPWPQKGPAVPMPLAGIAPVRGIGISGTAADTFANATVKENGIPSKVYANYFANSATIMEANISGTTAQPTIYADLSSATGATINQLRQSFQVQRLYERDARGGSRYTEIIKAHFGVTSPDARLQRPEYLGGGSSMININPIAQTSAAAAQPTPQGNLAAMGTVNVSGHGFSKSFTEHCIIIGLASVRADLTYQNGLDRMFSRSTRFDFYWPALSHIGEQAVLNKEIYAQGTSADDLVFGYQERHAEYRYKPSKITGKMRSNDPQPLDSWHLAQKFTALPTLSDAFIQENPPVSRVIAVQTEPHFLLDCYFDYKCARPMPLFSVPGLIDHF